MLRPERIDTIIRIALPDKPTIKRLVQQFAGERLDPIGLGPTLEQAADVLEGCTPAIIKEVINRCVLDMFVTGSSHFSGGSIAFHATAMDLQKQLASPSFRSSSSGEKLAESLYGVVRGYK